MTARADELVTTTVKTEEDFVKVFSGSIVVLSSDKRSAHPPHPVGAEPCIVGRGRHCHVSVADRTMSTSHFQLRASPDGICVTDEGSRNGTWVNGVRLKPNNSVYLDRNARLLGGRTWFDLLITGEEQIAVSTASSLGSLVGRSIAMREMYAKIAKVGPTDLSVLITGESGTGKELVAQAIHEASLRRGKPFVVVDCATIPANLAETRLFGHKRGAFTGAVADAPSPFIEAKGGTIFLDEIGELPEETQAKLLRALEARQIQPVGSTRYEPIDVRIIAATKRNLHEEINARRFREDLYYRFAKVVIETPALRARLEDIPDVVEKVLSSKGDPTAFARVDSVALERLKRHNWPGNVRELRNVVEVAAELSAGGPIDFAEALGPLVQSPRSAERSTTATFDEHQNAAAREYFMRLAAEEGAANISAMARKSGLSRTRLRFYLDQFGLRPTKVTHE